jgi:hypothetical protein
MTDELLMPDTLATTYLQQLYALAQEMNGAISAIAGNALLALEGSVAKQEMLCAGLAAMKSAAQRELRIAAHRASPIQPNAAVASEIWAASEAIRALNLQYASLLKHSGRSIALLSALCRSHSGQFQEARGPRLKHQTWSCEM